MPEVQLAYIDGNGSGDNITLIMSFQDGWPEGVAFAAAFDVDAFFLGAAAIFFSVALGLSAALSLSAAAVSLERVGRLDVGLAVVVAFAAGLAAAFEAGLAAAFDVGLAAALEVGLALEAALEVGFLGVGVLPLGVDSASGVGDVPAAAESSGAGEEAELWTAIVDRVVEA
jgi:hypothetical protein